MINKTRYNLPARSWRVTLYLRDRSYRDHQIPRGARGKVQHHCSRTRTLDSSIYLFWAQLPAPLQLPRGYAPILHASTDLTVNLNNWADPVCNLESLVARCSTHAPHTFTELATIIPTQKKREIFKWYLIFCDALASLLDPTSFLKCPFF